MDDYKKYIDKIEKSLLKKALGYQYKEVIEEYSIGEDGEKLSKKKITTKDVPPDISAVKLLLEELKNEIKKALKLLESNAESNN